MTYILPLFPEPPWLDRESSVEGLVRVVWALLFPTVELDQSCLEIHSLAGDFGSGDHIIPEN